MSARFQLTRIAAEEGRIAGHDEIPERMSNGRFAVALVCDFIGLIVGLAALLTWLLLLYVWLAP